MLGCCIDRSANDAANAIVGFSWKARGLKITICNCLFFQCPGNRLAATVGSADTSVCVALLIPAALVCVSMFWCMFQASVCLRVHSCASACVCIRVYESFSKIGSITLSIFSVFVDIYVKFSDLLIPILFMRLLILFFKELFANINLYGIN